VRSRLVAIDLDGTLLRADKSLSDRSRAALHSVQRAGIVVTVVSARGPRGVREIVSTTDLGGAAICSNGAIVIDLPSGSIRRLRAFETEVAVELVHALRRRVPGVLFGVEREAFAHEPGFSAWEWTPPPGTRVADAVELLDQPPTKLIARHADHDVEALAAAAEEVAGDIASVSVSGSWVVEISPAGVNKAAALAELCDELDVAASEVVAFGDHLNDIPMLSWAGRSVAVANAHPEVTAAAGEVTASNDDDGVAIVLEQLVA
jgi:Cof subfamily protein (haloacid dehalogenase superfamily)